MSTGIPCPIRCCDPEHLPAAPGLEPRLVEQGIRFRALEQEAATTSGTFYFGHLLYEDGTAYPTEIETGDEVSHLPALHGLVRFPWEGAGLSSSGGLIKQCRTEFTERCHLITK
jgi:hypothetical protein